MNKAELFASNPIFWAFRPDKDDLIPAYNSIKPEHLEPAFNWAAKLARQKMRAITQNPHPPTLNNTIIAYEKATAFSDYIHTLCEHLMQLKSSPEMSEAAKKVAQTSKVLYAEITNNALFFKRVKTLHENKLNTPYTQADKVVLIYFNDWLESYHYKMPIKIQRRLTKLEHDIQLAQEKFEDNLQAAENKYRFLIFNPADLSGIPESLYSGAKAQAKKMGYENAWAFDGSADTRSSVLLSAEKRHVREKYFKETDLIGTQEPHNNLEVFKKILVLRNERARLLGSRSHTNHSVNSGMLFRRKQVYQFLDLIKTPIMRAAYKERKKFQAMALLDGIEKIEPWDIPYYQEKLKLRQFGLKDSAFIKYFDLDAVLRGALGHLEKFYEIEITENHQSDKPDINARNFDIRSKGEKVATLTLDFFAREGKSDTCNCQSLLSHGYVEGKKIVPPINITFNFPLPSPNQACVMKLTDVESIFHELGHAMHEVFSQTPYRNLSGFSPVIYDFIEFPSQMNENWLYEPAVLDTYAFDYETKEKMPDDLKKKILNRRSFFGGTFLLKHLKLSYLDLELYSYSPNHKNFDVAAFEKATLKRIFKNLADGPLESARFRHITTLGMDSGYYRYLFAEALEADAYSIFQDKGLYDPETRNRFKHLLAHSALDYPQKNYENFRGHPFSVLGFLKRYNLTKTFKKSSTPESFQIEMPFDNSGQPLQLDIHQLPEPP